MISCGWLYKQGKMEVKNSGFDASPFIHPGFWRKRAPDLISSRKRVVSVKRCRDR